MWSGLDDSSWQIRLWRVVFWGTVFAILAALTPRLWASLAPDAQFFFASVCGSFFFVVMGAVAVGFYIKEIYPRTHPVRRVAETDCEVDGPFIDGEYQVLP